jgi:hypothetical protein
MRACNRGSMLARSSRPCILKAQEPEAPATIIPVGAAPPAAWLSAEEPYPLCAGAMVHWLLRPTGSVPVWPLLTGSGNCKTVPPAALLPEIVTDRSPAAARLPSQVTVSVFVLEDPPQPVRRAGKIRRAPAPSNRRLGIASHFLLEAHRWSFAVLADEDHPGGCEDGADGGGHWCRRPALEIADGCF